jgi:DNA polymerase-3 subunit delta'
MKFTDIPGYESIKDKLTKAADSGQVAHAQLFACTEGGFGLMMALAYAQYLNCENPADGDSCGTCFSCIKSSKFVHPDIHYLFPVAKSKKTDSDELAALTPSFRNFLSDIPFGSGSDWAETAGFENRTPIINVRAVRDTIQGLQLKAFEGRYKIQLIWQPETLRAEGANSLLKILEEPPAKTVFILVSREPENLLPTLISRMQRVGIPIPVFEQIISFLSKRFGEDSERLKNAVSLSEGSVPQAIKLMEEKEDDYHRWYMEWLRACFRQDTARFLQLAEEFQEMGKELQKTFLKYCLEKTRKAFIFSSGAGEILHVQEAEKTDLEKLGKILHGDTAERMLSELDKTWYHIDRNASARMVFFDCSMGMASAFRLPKTLV